MSANPPSLPPRSPEPDDLATPLAWIGADANLAGCNLAFSRWLGVGRRRVLGQPLAALEREGARLAAALAAAPGDAAALAPQRLRRVALGLPGEPPRFADLWLSPQGDGGWWLEAHPVPEFDGATDQALPAAMSAAFRGLAHELRNPLAGLKGAAQLLARRHRGDADASELLGLVDAEVDRLAALLDRLLSPQPARPHAPLNLHAVLEKVLKLAENDAGWAVQLLRDYDPSLPEPDGDADRLTQAVWNLVRNAIEAGAARVTLRTRAEHGARIGDAAHALVLRLDVVDDGHGVPEDLGERLFLPLVSGRAEGSGLGLALAQQVAREHGGTLVYRSRPGHTVFSLLLPLQREDADAA